ncbi:hypothetical protein RYD26_02175 [Pasteurellaceae bacterium LIM206]|nr:hypothetical protein [Pasteurellaceae bacterium LIM206]
MSTSDVARQENIAENPGYRQGKLSKPWPMLSLVAWQYSDDQLH